MRNTPARDRDAALARLGRENEDLRVALRWCMVALDDVAPQIRGALCINEVRNARRIGRAALREAPKDEGTW